MIQTHDVDFESVIWPGIYISVFFQETLLTYYEPDLDSRCLKTTSGWMKSRSHSDFCHYLTFWRSPGCEWVIGILQGERTISNLFSRLSQTMGFERKPKISISILVCVLWTVNRTYLNCYVLGTVLCFTFSYLICTAGLQDDTHILQKWNPERLSC